MTRVLAALAAVMVACTSSQPAAVTVAPLATSSALPLPASSEEHYDDLGCSAFAKDGAAENATAWRRCLEGTTASDICASGASPDLATLELAVSLIDETGGPADIPRARKLLKGCFVDVAVQAVLEHAEKKEKDPQTKPFDSCEVYAQTTLAMTDCALERTQGERAWMRRIRHELAREVRPLFDAATQAHEAYARKLGELEYQRYAGGTFRSPAMVDKIRYLLHERRVRLQAMRSFVPARVTNDDLAAARDEIQRTYAAAHDAEPDAKVAVEEASHAYLAYRDAEVSFYERIRPGSRESITLLLGREHAAHLCASVPP